MLACSKRLATRRYHRQFSIKSAFDTYLEPRGADLPGDFRLLPTFLDKQEQRLLLLAALRKLDDVGSRETRRKRKGKNLINTDSPRLNDLFLPDDCYNFEEVIIHSHAGEK